MNFDEFIQENKYCHALKEGLALWKIPAEIENIGQFTLEHVHSIIIVQNGELKIDIGGRQHTLSQNHFVDLVDRPSVELISSSDDIVAYQLLFTEPFIANLLKNRPPFPFSYIVNTRQQPISVLATPVLQVFMQKIEYIESIFRDNTHFFQTEMLKCALWMFFLDVANAHIHQEGESNQLEETDRKKMLFIQFMKLLPIHIKKEHIVSFYASELCITPQYLNRIVKINSGRTVYDWISVTLVGEISRLLENKEDSIQQIADSLNFPDQATLTKFFKRQTGMSPTEYRKQLTL